MAERSSGETKAPNTPTLVAGEQPAQRTPPFDDEGVRSTNRSQPPSQTTEPMELERASEAVVLDELTDPLEDDVEPAPAAMRPLGRLGGDSGGWALALDYGGDDAEDSADDGETVESDRLDAWVADTAKMEQWDDGGTPEADRLEGWLVENALTETDKAT